MENRKKTYALIFAGLGIAINLVLGTLAKTINIPLLFLDTVGTIFTAAVFGPAYGALTGGLTNLIQGVITGPKVIPFALVNIVVGLVVGFMAKKRKFDPGTAIVTGLILSLVAPLVGTPIAVYVYGGITGDFNDVFFTILKNSGQKIFTAAFLPRVASNIVDKVLSCLLVALLLDKIPKKYTNGGL